MQVTLSPRAHVAPTRAKMGSVLNISACSRVVLFLLVFWVPELGGREVRRRCHHHGCVGVTNNEVGAEQVRLVYKDTMSMETSVLEANAAGLRLREIYNGSHVVKTLYDMDKNIIDCDVLNTSRDEYRFWKKFFGRKAKNTTVPRRIRQWKKHNKVEMLDKKVLEENYPHLLYIDQHADTCLEFQRQAKDRLYEEEKIRKDSFVKNESDSEQPRSREKRSTFIYPDTKWCGKGRTALNYTDLGVNKQADSCCREHDHCDYTVSGFSTDYNLFNYRFYTVSHCECDQRFLKCLKSAGDQASERVGYIYFHVVAIKCFVFRPHRTCMERKWWGGCKKYQTEYQAALKGPLRF